MILLRSVLIFCFAIVSADACSGGTPPKPLPSPPKSSKESSKEKDPCQPKSGEESSQEKDACGCGNLPKPPPPRPRPPTDASIPPVELPNNDEKAVKFAVTLLDNDSDETARCSGSIVSPHFAVTCCLHCLLNDNKRMKSADDLLVVYGDFKDASSVQFYVLKVKSVHIHHGCNFQSRYESAYDIGLVQTVDQFTYGPDVRPARITKDTTFGRPFTDTSMLLSSFRFKYLSATKREQSVWFGKVKYNYKCKELLHYMDYKRYNLCTNYNHSMGENNCLTDYGSSLSFEDEIGGILIHKVDCGAVGSVAGYVSISFNSKWLRTTVTKATHGEERIA